MSINTHSVQIELDMQLMNALNKVDRFDAAWEAMAKKENVVLGQLQFLAVQNSIGSAVRLSGVSITNDEVAVLLTQKNRLHFETKEAQEVAGYFDALDGINTTPESIGVSETQIKELHRTLFKYVTKDAWHRGTYKHRKNFVEVVEQDGVKPFVLVTPEPGGPTNDAMQKLTDWYYGDKETVALIKIAVFVYDFLSILPFQDGNGRLSRLLWRLLLLKRGYSWIRYVSLEQAIESRREEYLRVLRQTQRSRPNENVTAWLRFFLDCLMQLQQGLLLQLGEKTNEEQYTQREKRILFFIENHAGCGSGEIAKKLDMALPTVKKTLAELVEKSKINREGRGKATGYYIP